MCSWCQTIRLGKQIWIYPACYQYITSEPTVVHHTTTLEHQLFSSAENQKTNDYATLETQKRLLYSLREYNNLPPLSVSVPAMELATLWRRSVGCGFELQRNLKGRTFLQTMALKT
jgi:hypothetical protein